MPRPTAPAASTPPPAARDVSRYIPHPIQCLLWGRAAGRCEFAGCNKPLLKSSVTQEQVNIAEKAHIHAFSGDGPRGNAGVRDEDLNSHANLMLLCHECHEKIDRKPDGGRYTVALLQAMKAAHERRVETVTAIDPSRRSHVLLYGANIGEHPAPHLLEDAAAAMFPDRYPAEAVPLALGLVNSSAQDRSPAFWDAEATHLRTQFGRRVAERIADREIDHLSVFALAPQPLLVLLGTLLGDITPADVYQRRREPPTWAWAQPTTAPEFTVIPPAATEGPPALVLSLSATITSDRIAAVLGADASIWTVTVVAPHNDLFQTREQLARFRALLRPLLDRIKATHGQTTPLHVFPAAPMSAAVEFGRIRMPKADATWLLYDQVNARGGFVHALTIPQGA